MARPGERGQGSVTESVRFDRGVHGHNSVVLGVCVRSRLLLRSNQELQALLQGHVRREGLARPAGRDLYEIPEIENRDLVESLAQPFSPTTVFDRAYNVEPGLALVHPGAQGHVRASQEISVVQDEIQEVLEGQAVV